MKRLLSCAALFLSALAPAAGAQDWGAVFGQDGPVVVAPDAQGRWVLETLRGRDGALDAPTTAPIGAQFFIPAPDYVPAIEIAADGTISGALDCNHQGPMVTLSEDGAFWYGTASPVVTLIGCLPYGAVLSQSPDQHLGTQVSDAMADAVFARVNRGHLTLLDGAGEVVARFAR